MVKRPPCTCDVSKDTVQWNDQCPYHGKDGTMIAVLRETRELRESAAIVNREVQREVGSPVQVADDALEILGLDGLDAAVEALYAAANFAFTELDADGEAAAVLTVALVNYEAIKAHDVLATPTVQPLLRKVKDG